MSQSNFDFLRAEYPSIASLGVLAERSLYADPSNTLAKLRIIAEKLTLFAMEYEGLEHYNSDKQFDNLQTLQREASIPPTVMDTLHTIRKSGNKAAHSGYGTSAEARFMLKKVFQLCSWFYETYEETDVLVTYTVPVEQEALEKSRIAELEAQIKSQQEEIDARDEKIRRLSHLSTQEKARQFARSEKAASNIEMSEAETRERIDEQLRHVGWEVDTETLNFKKNKTLPEKGKNKAIAEWPTQGKWADYALFIGTELYGFVEAKKYAQDISTDLSQAKVYANKVEAKHEAKLLGEWGELKVPFLFSTNGRPYLEQIKTKSGIWFLDVRHARNRSRPLRGWYSPEGLIELLEQDIKDSNKKLVDAETAYLQQKNGLSLRDYQIKAIKAVEAKIASETEERRALLEMATGTGKTRTILGLCYRLIKANRFKRILFLVDRRLLATQSWDTFKDTKIEDLNSFAEIYKIEGLKETIPDLETRLHFSTVQGMVKRLFYAEGEENQLPIDAYDCIIVDEAHRGYLQDREMDEDDLDFKDQKDYVSKYRLVLDYFDAYAIGLTATPALHTKEIFGEAVFRYTYREAVIDGYLIDYEPPYIIKTQLSEEGIVWLKGEKPKVYDRETNEIVELSELEDELSIDITGFNKLVITEAFNRTVVKELVKELDPEGEEKTLIFAAKDEHADRLVQYLKEEFEAIGVDVPDEAITKITGKSYDPQGLVKRYKNEKYPSIAVTVDLLTTGVDVPAICNLVFMRRIRSRILYEQMLGRATRRCDEIGKETFRIFDAVRIYEALEDFTTMKPVVPTPKTTFTQLVAEFDAIDSNERARKQLEQIIAKLQRKKNRIEGHNEDRFAYNTQGQDPDTFIQTLKDLPQGQEGSSLQQYGSLWKFLDELKPPLAAQFVSEHEDAYLGTERGYGKGKAPGDYLESFQQFILDNQNRIAALQVICTRPASLDRQSLKELMLLLDEEGYTTGALNSAWKATKKEDIAADIISYIRTLALGDALMNHEERVRLAMAKVRGLKDWNKVQQKWIDRFEKQLLKETVLQKEDLDSDPFQQEGGFTRLDKIFDHQLETVLSTLNEALYKEIG